MKKYTKINTLYKRYMFDPKDCPVEKWKKMRGNIIPYEFSDNTIKYLYHNNIMWEAYVKVDGTNSKIAFFPSTGEVRVEGKDENSKDQCGQFKFLAEIAERIRPILCEMFPKESARFGPVISKETKKPVYYQDTEHCDTPVETIEAGKMYGVQITELPIYIYGEYYGEGIQACGKRYIKGGHDFAVFDIDQQGWWVPKDVRDEMCKKLGLKQVPFYGISSLPCIVDAVRQGFTTKVSGVEDPTLLEEGLVCRPTVPLFDSRKERIIVKVKHSDYLKFDRARNEFTVQEFDEFKEWYKENYR